MHLISFSLTALNLKVIQRVLLQLQQFPNTGADNAALSK